MRLRPTQAIIRRVAFGPPGGRFRRSLSIAPLISPNLFGSLFWVPFDDVHINKGDDVPRADDTATFIIQRVQRPREFENDSSSSQPVLPLLYSDEVVRSNGNCKHLHFLFPW